MKVSFAHGVTPSHDTFPRKWGVETRKGVRKVSHGVLYRTRDTLTPSRLPHDPLTVKKNLKVSWGVGVTPSHDSLRL